MKMIVEFKSTELEVLIFRVHLSGLLEKARSPPQAFHEKRERPHKCVSSSVFWETRHAKEACLTIKRSVGAVIVSSIVILSMRTTEGVSEFDLWKVAGYT